MKEAFSTTATDRSIKFLAEVWRQKFKVKCYQKKMGFWIDVKSNFCLFVDKVW